jgi:hypothetical protein
MVLGVGLAGAIFTTGLARGSAGAGDMAALFPAVQASFLIAAFVAFAGAMVSAIRGS